MKDNKMYPRLSLGHLGMLLTVSWVGKGEKGIFY
jgi:hypothetical protein